MRATPCVRHVGKHAKFTDKPQQKPDASSSPVSRPVKQSEVEFELTALHECTHKHVVELLGTSHVDKDTFVVVERCDGDLTQFLTSPREEDERSVARMMRQVRALRACRAAIVGGPRAHAPQLATALAHVHSRGIAHFDVKPANVRLAADGGIRLADFGNAARVPASRRGGTPMFAAPELFQDGLVGCAADAWSFGVLVYTLLAGFPPFFPHEGGRSGELKEQVSVQRS